MSIHSSAIVDKKAQIGSNVTMGPFCHVGENVVIDDDAVFGSNVVIEGWTKIGKNCRISSGAVLGGHPQITGYKDMPSWVHIGDNCEIREFVTIHRSSQEDGITSVGNGVYLMNYSHVAHDCIIGDNVIVTNYAGFAGHVEVGEKAVISSFVAIHQFTRVGKLAMVGGMSGVTKDVPPYSLISGTPPKLYGINTIGLRRSNISPSVRGNLKKAFKLISGSNLNTRQALDRIKKEIPGCKELNHLVEFIETSKRGIHK